MSQLEQNTATIKDLIATAEALPDAGGGGGSGMDTCRVTIIQSWGGNDDPSLLRLWPSYYDIQTDGSIALGHAELTSANDYQSQHSVTFTAVKGIPVSVVAYGVSGSQSSPTASSNGGVVEELHTYVSSTVYRAIPTADTATFTFASP